MNKLTTSDHKIEGKLRILRSYRIKLGHQYCREVLRDSYQESISTQLLQVGSDLRLKANLLPSTKKSDFILCGGVSEFLENLPRDMIKHSCFANDPVYNIDNYQTGIFKTLFYVPSSSEICNLDNKILPEHKVEINFASGIAEQIEENDLEASIKNVMTKKPTIVKRYKGFKNASEYAREGIVVTNFEEAYTYGGQGFNMLVYMTLINNIFDLEYTIQKLNSSGRDIFALEKNVYSGQLFWKDEAAVDQEDSDTNDSNHNDKEINTKPQTISTKIIKRIVQARRERRHLFDDLQIIRENLNNIKKYIKNKDEGSIDKMINILINHHYFYYYLTLHGMEKMQEIYGEKEQKKEFRTMIDYINMFSDRNEGIVIHNSGFHVNQALIKPHGCDLETKMYHDYTDFNRVYQHPIDELYLIPPYVRLIGNIYGDKTFNNCRITQFAGQNAKCGYPALKWGFMNMTDLDRVFAHTTYTSIQKELDEYSSLPEIGKIYAYACRRNGNGS